MEAIVFIKLIFSVFGTAIVTTHDHKPLGFPEQSWSAWYILLFNLLQYFVGIYI